MFPLNRYEQEHRDVLALAERNFAERNSDATRQRAAVKHAATLFFIFAMPRWTSGKHFVMEISVERIESLIKSTKDISEECGQAISFILPRCLVLVCSRVAIDHFISTPFDASSRLTNFLFRHQATGPAGHPPSEPPTIHNRRRAASAAATAAATAAAAAAFFAARTTAPGGVRP